MTGPGRTPARVGLIVHHTDAEREWACDRTSHIGKLDKALDEANAKDWKWIFQFESESAGSPMMEILK